MHSANVAWNLPSIKSVVCDCNGTTFPEIFELKFSKHCLFFRVEEDCFYLADRQMYSAFQIIFESYHAIFSIPSSLPYLLRASLFCLESTHPLLKPVLPNLFSFASLKHYSDEGASHSYTSNKRAHTLVHFQKWNSEACKKKSSSVNFFTGTYDGRRANMPSRNFLLHF